MKYGCEFMANNSNKMLGKAKENKKDEFYTQLVDIEKEMKYYKNHFKDKIVFWSKKQFFRKCRKRPRGIKKRYV